MTEISEDFTVLSIIRKIVTDEIERPFYCLQFTPDALIVTCVSLYLTNDGTGVKFLTVDDEVKVEYSFHNTDFNIGFLIGICEATNGICVGDYAKHCVYQLDIANKIFRPVIGSYDSEGQEDGPSDKATLSHPAGIASRGDAIYIAEHPPNYQGAIQILLLRWPYQLPIILEWYCIISGSSFKAHGATEPSSGKGNKN